MKLDGRLSLALIMVLFLTGCRFPLAHLPSKLPTAKLLNDKPTLESLDKWAESLKGIDKVLKGEMLCVFLVDPVYVVSPDKKVEIDQAGFGQEIEEPMTYSEEFKFDTPLDKCGWLSAFIGYPLEFKLGITPGITYSGISYGQSYDKVGRGRYKPGDANADISLLSGKRENMIPDGYVIDDLEAWASRAEPHMGMYERTPEGDRVLYVEIAIVLPEGDAWLDDMDTSFRDSDKLTLHLKAYRKEFPGKIAYGSVDVLYKNILPFLTELAATIASVQGFHEITDKQKAWLANEPVMNINAWGEFLEAYAKRTWSQSCTDSRGGPETIKNLNGIYGRLGEKDPGNTVYFMYKDSIWGSMGDRSFQKSLEWALEHKPYLPYIYERTRDARQQALVAKGGIYDASELWVRAVKARPDIAKFHMYNAGVLLGNGDYDGAVDEYRTCIRIEPGMNLNLWHGLRMWTGRLQGDVDMDIETRFAEMVVGQYPDATTERDYLATLYQMRGDDDKAFEQYDLTKDLNVGRNLGKQYTETGRTDEAIAIYEKLVVDHAYYGHNWLELADLYKTVNNDEKELWALQGFLDNIVLENSGWPSYLPDVNARIAGLKGDVSGQIRNLLAEYPYMYSADERNLDLAEALYDEGYLNDALFLVYNVLAQLDFHRSGFSDKEQKVWDRAMKLRQQYLKEFWPEFDASKALESQPYPSPYAEAKQLKKDGRVSEAMEEYRKLLDEYPSLIEVREYVMMIEQLYKDDLEAILEAKLMEVIVSEAVDETGSGHGHSARSGLRNWGDTYERHLKEKLVKLYGIAE